MDKPKILIVDDDLNICEILTYSLNNNGYEAKSVNSAEEAIKEIKGGGSFSLILLDVMMEGMSGYKMAEQIRAEGNTIPIIFITAKNTENDMLTGFYIGGDDYIAKPFSLQEVLARVAAVIRRSPQKQGEEKNTFEYNNLYVNFETKEVLIEGIDAGLTKTEFGIFELLVKNPNRIFPRSEIINRIWDESTYITERTVDVHITRLRKKLGEYASMVSNRSGYGYRFNFN